MKGFIQKTFLVMCIGIAPLHGQQPVEYPGRPRYPDGLLGLSIGAGPAKYIGEFNDGTVGSGLEINAQYNIIPELGLGARFGLGNATYERRVRSRLTDMYRFQFNTLDPALRSTSYHTFQLYGKINLFPRQYFNIYVFGGFGVTIYLPEDYLDDAVQVRTRKDTYLAPTLPVGFGVEYFLSRTVTLYSSLNAQIMFIDDFDAFPSGEVREAYYESQGIPVTPVTEGGDGIITWHIGIRYFLFEDEDLDDDLLTNREEERIGTNPYHPDTDGDHLSDFEEAKTYHTDPLLPDSDRDGLSDLQEVRTYRTDPVNADSDADGIDDGAEVTRYMSDPLSVDTDGDSLTDAEEVEKGTNPLMRDSDSDGLTDDAELKIHHTDPLLEDSDSDSLADAREIAMGTDPLIPDTDRDGLMDGEEAVEYRTDPRVTDTDGDGLSDYDELRRTGTDPLNADSDGDGINDKADRCPLLAEVFNGYEDRDGCPDAKGGARSAIAESTVRVDTLILREGMTITLFGVNFEHDRAQIRPESIPILEVDAKLFGIYPELVVEVRGHTDAVGGFEHNMDLSQRRADAVRDYLVDLGVAPERLIAKGFGETQPIATNATDLGRARNRRTEFYIVKAGKRVGEGR